LGIAAIAELDVPEGEWEELLPRLVQYINSDDVALVRGAISVNVTILALADKTAHRFVSALSISVKKSILSS
jgi:hypothetical protein